MSDMDPTTRSAAELSLSRRHLVAGAGAALVPAFARPRQARAQAKNRLTFALSSYPPSIRPWQNTGTAAATVKLTLYRGLLSYDAKGEIRGELAESWKRENDRTWTFTLRQGARFQDGEPVTADAVRFTFDQILGAKSTAYMKGTFAALIEKVEAVNARTVRFVLKQPSATFMFLLASFHRARKSFLRSSGLHELLLRLGQINLRLGHLSLELGFGFSDFPHLGLEILVLAHHEQ
jgi:peptide/nickel transport system substrate-binding protein